MMTNIIINYSQITSTEMNVITIFYFRQEMERQRLAEWEKQRKAELVQHRQREQEKVLELKAKKENIDSEFETMVCII